MTIQLENNVCTIELNKTIFTFDYIDDVDLITQLEKWHDISLATRIKAIKYVLYALKKASL